MFKWFLLLVGLVLFYLWFKGQKKVRNIKKSTTSPESKTVHSVLDPETMVQCGYCKVHLPQSAALPHEQRFYCSKAHLQALDSDGWIGSANWRISPNQDPRLEAIKPDLAVIHHISLPPGGFEERQCTQFIVDFFQNKLNSALHPYFEEISEQKVSSHFLISRRGELFQFVSTHNKAWHAGLSSFLGREKCNDFSIGIELEGDNEHIFEEIQYTALAILCNELTLTYPDLAFAGHSDISPNRKIDPGIQFDWKQFQTKSNISKEKLPFGLQRR